MMTAAGSYQQLIYAVDPSTGTVGNALTGNTWYDPSGNVLQQISPGDGIVFSKNAYNGVNWITSSYRGYNASGTSYSQATTVANDTILEQTDYTYDEVGDIVSCADEPAAQRCSRHRDRQHRRALLRDAAQGPRLLHGQLVRRDRPADRLGQLRRDRQLHAAQHAARFFQRHGAGQPPPVMIAPAGFTR